MRPNDIIALMQYASNQSVTENVSRITEAKLVYDTNEKQEHGGQYALTDRGKAFVEYLTRVPLPEKRWEVPMAQMPDD